MEVNRAPGGGASSARRPPKVRDHRLAGRQPIDAVQRHGKLRLADALAESEASAVPAQKFGRGSIARVHLDLLDGRVAFHVNDALATQQIVVEFMRAANVEQGVGPGVQIVEEPAGKASGFVRRFVARRERPAVFKTELRRQPRESLRRVGVILGHRLQDGIIRHP